ncbi:MAG: DUF3467 domain-containing protein [Deltaproteobacteria bacterium]|nr:DUF3467 domain-containing protein [Deltaproteobacteria bacterium]
MAEEKPTTPAAPQQLQLQLHVDDTTASGVYVNMALVNHNETEFVLDFIYVQPQVAKGTVRSRVITSPKHFKRLIAAMQDNISRYEAQFGKVDVSGPAPQPWH